MIASSSHPDILRTVGHTPRVKLNRVTAGLKLIVTIGCSTGERCLSTALAGEARRKVGG